MKKLLTIIAIAFSINAFAQSGTCGANLTWTLNDSTLTISGTENMTNWVDDTHVSWLPYKATNINCNDWRFCYFYWKSCF